MNHHVALKYILNRKAREGGKHPIPFINMEIVARVRAFHRSFPQYAKTPLHSLNALSRLLEVGNIWVKDESYRFGLNAFKVLGGSYAIGKYLANQLNVDISELSYEKLKSPEIKEQIKDITFVTATDGNHGRGIAWAANQLGLKSVVFMPKGSSEFRLNSILKEGAHAEITGVNYDETVRMSRAYAVEHQRF